MNRYAVLALTAPVLAAGGTMTPVLVGGYQPAAVDSPMALEARAFIQKHLAILRLDRIQEAYTQVVAGTKVKLVCQVSGEGAPSRWEFVAWRKLDGTWELQSARRV
jgi:hypothetical protein